MIRTLLLDVDGVLQCHRPGFVAAIERDYAWRRGFLAFQRELTQDPGEARSLVGDGDLLTVVERILPRHVRGLKAEVFLERWLRESIQLNHELLDLIAHLTVSQIYLATNQEPRRGARIAELYADRPWLTGILVSHEIGHKKPDRAFFEEALARIGRQPQDCLFIDDNPVFVAGAVAAGLPSLQFHSNLQLVAELTERGLLVE